MQALCMYMHSCMLSLQDSRCLTQRRYCMGQRMASDGCLGEQIPYNQRCPSTRGALQPEVVCAAFMLNEWQKL